MDDKQFIIQLEADLRHIILAYPVYGQHPYYDMIGKVYEKVKEYNAPEVKKELDNTYYEPTGPNTNTCKNCGKKRWNHPWGDRYQLKCPRQ